MQIISHLKKHLFNSTLILRVIIGITILTIGAVIFYNQMLSIAEKKTVSNYNLLQGCIKETPHEQEEERCFKKYPIDLRFVDLTVADSEIRIIQKYYASVVQQQENYQIQDWAKDYMKYLDDRERVSRNSQIHDLLLIFVFIFFLVFVILVIRLTIRWLESRSQEKKKDIAIDHEEEDDCKCDDCLKKDNED